jgi:hypothetical protein
MGFFDGAFGNKKEEDFEPIRAVQPQKGQVLITFLPSGAQVNAKPGNHAAWRVHECREYNVAGAKGFSNFGGCRIYRRAHWRCRAEGGN